MSERRPGLLHRFDLGALVAGVFFLAIAGNHLLGRNSLSLTFLAPLVLIGLGVVGIVLVLTRSRRRPR